MTPERRSELLRACGRQPDDADVLSDDGAMFYDIEPLTTGELREMLRGEPDDPIASAVRAELQPLEDALIDAGHKLAKRPFECVVHRAGRTDPPQDCDWPFCGCDEHATRVIATLQECGWGPNAPSSSQLAETPSDGFQRVEASTGEVLLVPAETPEERKDAK